MKVLPQVFADYKERFPGVQMQVVRSHGSKTVQSILDNSVDFGITQLPVTDMKIAVVQVHSDEIRLLVPPGHVLAERASVGAEDIAKFPLLLPKQAARDLASTIIWKTSRTTCRSPWSSSRARWSSTSSARA